MEPYHLPHRQVRLPSIVAGVLILTGIGLLVATCGSRLRVLPGEAGNGNLIQKVGLQLQAALGRQVTIHSDGAISFPKEVVEVVMENHMIHATTRYQSHGWFGLVESHVVMSGTYRARIGFDLGRAGAQFEGGVLRLWVPPACHRLRDPRCGQGRGGHLLVQPAGALRNGGRLSGQPCGGPAPTQRA